MITRGAIAGLAISALAASGLTACGTSSSNNTLEIGAVVSLTGAGNVYGATTQRGIQLAEEQLNAKGQKVHVTIVDDGSDKQQAAQQTQKLIQENKVVALLGPTLSNSAVAAHPIAANSKTPMLAVSNTGINIVGPGCTYCNGWIFRDSLGEADAIPANIKTYADAHHPKTAALVFPNDDKFSADGATIVKQTVSKYGITLADSVEFTKAEPDVTPYVTKALAHHPDVLFITSLGGIPAKIMAAARAQGFTGQFLGGNGFNTAIVSKQAGANGKGAQSGAAWFINNDFTANKDFVAAYKAKFNGDAPDQFAAQAYTGLIALADAAKRSDAAGKSLTDGRKALRDALEKTDIQSPLGEFKFTADHDVDQTIWIQQMDGNGGFTLIGSTKKLG